MRYKQRHWHNFQVYILVHISYKKNPFSDSLEYEPAMIKEVHYYVLDDTMNDTLFIEPVFMLHWCHLQDHGCSPKFHFVLSNG
jgi:hypothetical protein